MSRHGQVLFLHQPLASLGIPSSLRHFRECPDLGCRIVRLYLRLDAAWTWVLFRMVDFFSLCLGLGPEDERQCLV